MGSERPVDGGAAGCGKRLSDDIQWTTDLGNAFLAQEADVMIAVQRMRRKAQALGHWQSDQQQVVETRVWKTRGDRD